MITEFINGLKGLQPLTGPDDIQPGRVLCMEYHDHRYQPIRWFYKVIKPKNNSRDWEFESFRIQMDNLTIYNQEKPIYRFSSFGTGGSSYRWYWFEHYPQLQYNPNQQGDTDEDI